MQTKQTITKKMLVPTGKVWDAVRQFGGLDVWFPSFDECRIEGEGIGACRYLTIAGGMGDITTGLSQLTKTNGGLPTNAQNLRFP